MNKNITSLKTNVISNNTNVRLHGFSTIYTNFVSNLFLNIIKNKYLFRKKIISILHFGQGGSIIALSVLKTAKLYLNVVINIIKIRIHYDVDNYHI